MVKSAQHRRCKRHGLDLDGEDPRWEMAIHSPGLGKFHGLRILVGDSAGVFCKELDLTEHIGRCNLDLASRNNHSEKNHLTALEIGLRTQTFRTR